MELLSRKSPRLSDVFWGTLVALAAPLATWATPVIGPLAPVATSVERYQKFEVKVPVTGTIYTNPYDFDPAAGGAVLRATVTAPSGAVKLVDGYYADGYALTNPTTGTLGTVPAQNGWRVRFTPTETGVYTYTLTFADGGGTSASVAGAFTATASADNGFIRRIPGKNYLRFDSNAPYIPVGENLCWGGGNGLGDFKKYLDKLSLNRANMVRVWLCYWGIELEWKNGSGTGYAGLKRYAPNHAFELDWLLDYCAANGIYMELCINNHGQFQAGGQWPLNPYNSALGGPATSSTTFFTNATARAVYKNKLRYLVARYGYSKNLMAWEFFNELNLIDNYASVKAATASWCSEMAAYLKDIDPNQHFVTTSYTMGTGDAAVWNDPNIDFTQNHTYELRPDLEKALDEASNALRSAHNKPFQTGEFGIHYENNATMPDDPTGASFRTTMWASALNGSMGAGLTWWWDEWIHPLAAQTYPVMLGLRNFLDANVNVVANNYQPVAPEVQTPTAQALTVVPGYSGFQPPGYSATKPPFSAYTVGADGSLTPAASTLGRHLFGSWNPAQRNPPTFTFTLPVAGQCRVKVAAVGAGTTLLIKLDGATVLTQPSPAVNGVYTVNVPAGPHTVTLDNAGTDWLEVGSVEFTNLQPALTGNALRDGQRLVGYLRLRDYNWQYLQAHGQVAPPAVTGANLLVRSLTPNAGYTVTWSQVLTGAVLATTTAVASATGVLTMAVPTLNWDAAFVLTPAVVTGPAPRITSYTPASGRLNTAVAITGTNFTGATQVKIGAVNMAFTVVSATRITTKIPAGAVTGPLTVTTPGGSYTTVGVVKVLPPIPAITKVAPLSGPVGTLLTLTGTAFTGATVVKIGVASMAFTVVSATKITATIPAGAVTGKITVTTPGGTRTTTGSVTVTAARALAGADTVANEEVAAQLPDFLPNNGGADGAADPLATLALYPNPAHASARLELPAPVAAATTADLRDRFGRLVSSTPLAVGSREVLLDLHKLLPGVYAVRCGAHLLRLVVE